MWEGGRGLIDGRLKTTGTTWFKSLTFDVRGVFSCTCCSSSSWGSMALPPKGE